MAKREDLTDRLMSRADPGLSRRRYGDVDVYTGALAQRALRTLNARAFTMDSSIFVDPSFDPHGNSDDAGLLAHEDHHRRGSGGKGGGAAGHNDGEEQHARGLEEMTHHLMESGASLEEVLHEVRNGSAAMATAMGNANPEDIAKGLMGGDQERDPMAAYVQMRSEGTCHGMIIDDLRRHVVDTLDRLNAEHNVRSGGELDFYK